MRSDRFMVNVYIGGGDKGETGEKLQHEKTI